MKSYFSAVVHVAMLLITGVSMLSAQSNPGKSETPDSMKYTIENCINSFSMDKIEKTKVGYQYWFVDKNFADGKTLKMSVVAPHLSTHPPHVHAEDEFFFVLEGKAEFYLKDKWTPIGPYTSIYCPSNVAHGIRNAGDAELKYLVVKKYEKK